MVRRECWIPHSALRYHLSEKEGQFWPFPESRWSSDFLRSSITVVLLLTPPRPLRLSSPHATTIVSNHLHKLLKPAMVQHPGTQWSHQAAPLNPIFFILFFILFICRCSCDNKLFCYHHLGICHGHLISYRISPGIHELHITLPCPIYVALLTCSTHAGPPRDSRNLPNCIHLLGLS